MLAPFMLKPLDYLETSTAYFHTLGCLSTGVKESMLSFCLISLITRVLIKETLNLLS